MGRMGRIRTTVMIAAVGAVAAFALLLPTSGVDQDPPECTSAFGYVVPCGFGPEQRHGVGFAGAGAVVAALLVAAGSAAGRRDRGRE